MRWVYSLFVLSVVFLAGCGGGGGSNSSSISTNRSTGTAQGFVSLNSANNQPTIMHAVPSGQSPVVGAVITVSNSALTTTSAADGSFALKNVPIGVQTFQVTNKGATSSTTSLVTTGTNSIGAYKWTVLIYLDAAQFGADSLTQAATMNFNQLLNGSPSASDPNVAVLVQYALMPLANGATSSGNSWGGVRRYRVFQNNGEIIPSASSLANANMGDPNTLQAFINWGQQSCPAQHYLLVLWDHGSGWDSSFDDAATATNRAICIDEAHNAAIHDSDLSYALTTSSQSKVDVVTMDACLMSMLEVGYQIQGQANYLVSSQEESPVTGCNYQDITQKLVSTSGAIQPSDLATFIATDTYNDWVVEGQQAPFTNSAIDLSQMTSVASAVNTLSKQLIANGASDTPSAHNAWQATTAFSVLEPGYVPDPNYPEDIRDLYTYAQNIAADVPNAATQQDASVVESAVTNAVLVSKATADEPFAHGLSIYIPAFSTYNSPSTQFTGGSPLSVSYNLLALCKDDPYWPAWLDSPNR